MRLSSSAGMPLAKRPRFHGVFWLQDWKSCHEWREGLPVRTEHDVRTHYETNPSEFQEMVATIKEILAEDDARRRVA
jgi:hypothetical protein